MNPNAAKLYKYAICGISRLTAELRRCRCIVKYNGGAQTAEILEMENGLSTSAFSTLELHSEHEEFPEFSI